MNLRTRLRWRIARLMNLLPGQCWADLVDYPLGRSRLQWSPNDLCRPSVAECGSCYCGKLRAPEGGEQR